MALRRIVLFICILTICVSVAVTVIAAALGFWKPPEKGAREAMLDLAGKGILVHDIDGIDELIAIGCGVSCEPTYVNCVSPKRSIPVMRRFPEIRWVSAIHQAFGEELATLVTLPRLDRLSFIECNLPESLSFFADFDNLKELRIVGCDLTDAQLRLARLTMPLRVLDLDSNEGITQRGMMFFAHSSSLTRLSLSGTSVSALSFVEGMIELQQLDLSGTEIDDSDLKSLVALHKLHTLGLAGTHVTDNAVDTILEITSLRCLDVQSTEITQNGVAELRSRIQEVYRRFPETEQGK